MVPAAPPSTRPDSDAPVRVLQSFGTPRTTTNPYIVQLDTALAAEPSVEHLRFSWAAALVGRFDVLHLHWPEVLLGGDRRWKRWGKRMLFRLLLLRLRRGGVAVVRTVHNVEQPADVDRATLRLLVAVDRRVDHRILLNPVTEVADPDRATLILHGHYRDWFARYPRRDPVAGRAGYFGLIRRYKGVEALLAAYEEARADDPAISLRVGGKPSTEDLATMVRDTAGRVPGIETDLRFLDDAELVDLATSSQLIVLPYRFMHNSGGALAALSLDRPVLVPRNEVNEALADEVGTGWIHTYEGELSARRLREALRATEATVGRPDLSRREWGGAARAHVEAYRRAVAARRAR